MTIPDTVSPIALIIAPQGRDANVAGSLLAEAGIASLATRDIKAFATSLGDETAFGILAEEAVRSSDLKPIAAWIAAQPSWSDLPFIVLTQRGGGPERNPSAARLSEVLGNVTFLERPFHATTFVSVARTAMKGRRRQYEARARIKDLWEGERRLQTALQAGRLGTWELDFASMELSASTTCKLIYGRGAEENFSYGQLMASIHPEDRNRVEETMGGSFASGRDLALEYRTIWPDGSAHWAEVRAQLMKDRAGGRAKLVGVSSDITARKSTEDSLRRLNETLEERVTERTVELKTAHATLLDEISQRERAEEQLRQSQKMEAIGQLTGGVAHDFNNLLMAILGNLELLRKTVGNDPKAIRFIEGALQGARRGAALTQRLLAFARRQDLQVEPVDLAELVEGMRGLVQRSVGSAISMNITVAGGLPRALVDGNQVELALLNLVVNARDAMPDGGTLSIDVGLADIVLAKEDLSPGRYVVLSVADTGAGMNEETLKKAIDPFFSTKEVGKGTGLGLSMVHGLAVQLKGVLRLSSKVGMGTKAELWVPATDLLQKPLIQPSAASSPVSTSLIKILMVDDDALIAMSSVDMLEDMGYEVTEANSGSAALNLLQSGQHFDLLITDYSMPGMTGAQLAKAARALLPELPILLATGYADLPAGAGIDLPRLGKPYTQSQLATEIAKALQYKREDAPAQP